MRSLFLLLSLFLCQTAAAFDWRAYDQLLREHVHSGHRFGVSANLVDYAAIGKDPAFAAIAEQLANYNPAPLNKIEKLAFYINAYNYFAIKLVVDQQPQNSIKDIGNFFSPVWKKPAGKINGESVSLDFIEHQVLRKMGEPGIHFAIVCASLSCPDLRAEAYIPEDLMQQLNDQIQLFLNNPKGLKIENNTLYISNIFDWFSADFKPYGGVLPFLRLYKPELSGFDSFSSLDYDWRLNRWQK
ncbi:MAG: DUF547 domain-containing protein [Oceanospirillaceae bacterium]|nr:DUF547 domain-containing protein [Oceanospirillaceae bacterium]MCP5334786.1 DUF547 domain-containing protein [Oceanospirillaceae bacterium]MCP5350500.1 DUF547 domain-containing protein [Oceanospirillaceae bacterium]